MPPAPGWALWGLRQQCDGLGGGQCALHGVRSARTRRAAAVHCSREASSTASAVWQASLALFSHTASSQAVVQLTSLDPPLVNLLCGDVLAASTGSPSFGSALCPPQDLAGSKPHDFGSLARPREIYVSHGHAQHLVDSGLAVSCSGSRPA